MSFGRQPPPRQGFLEPHSLTSHCNPFRQVERWAVFIWAVFEIVAKGRASTWFAYPHLGIASALRAPRLTRLLCSPSALFKWALGECCGGRHKRSAAVSKTWGPVSHRCGANICCLKTSAQSLSRKRAPRPTVSRQLTTDAQHLSGKIECVSEPIRTARAARMNRRGEATMCGR